MQTSLVLPSHPYFHLVAILLFSLIGWWQIQSATAAVYECKAGNGSIVLTDKPKGFHSCVLVETMMSSPSSNSITAPATLHVPSQAQGDQGSSATPLPQMAPLPPRAELFEPRPVSPPPAATEHESQPCPPGINPLNPLARGHCSSDTPQSPDSTQEPLQSSP